MNIFRFTVCLTIVGPLVSILINKWSCRTVTAIGGVFYFLGSLMAAFSPNLLVLSLTYSIFTGTVFIVCFLIIDSVNFVRPIWSKLYYRGIQGT